MKALLAALATGTAPAEADPEAIDYFTVEVELMRQSADFTLCFSEDVANFTAFAPGSVVAEDAAAGSCIIGDTPLRVVFPNAKVEIGARAALLLAESSTPTD